MPFSNRKESLAFERPVKVEFGDYCNTGSIVYKYSITWTLEHVGWPSYEQQKKISSPPFYIGYNNQIRTCIDLYPYGVGDASDFFAVYLRPLSSFGSSIKGKLDVHINYDGNEEVQKRFISSTTFETDLGWGFSSFRHIRRTILNEAVITCTLWHFEERQNYWLYTSSLQDSGTLSDDLRQLLLDEEYSDLVIKVGGSVLKAHKAILATRSPVFAAMLRTDMSERKSGEIVIVDIDAVVIKALLCFIYTGRVKFKETVIHLTKWSKLLSAADKYDIPDLKKRCSEVLSQATSINNVAYLFRVAIMHNVAQLKADAASFISRNMELVVKTDGWESLKKTNPIEIIETFVEDKLFVF